MIEFKSFGKIARLNRDIVITEKIDGTQGAIGIVFESFEPSTHPDLPDNATIIELEPRVGLNVQE